MNRKLFKVLVALIASCTSIAVQAQVSPQSHDHSHAQAAIPAAAGEKMKMPASMGMGDPMHMERHAVSMMIHQDEMTLALVDLAINRAQHAELKDWAETTKEDKTQEIQQLKEWSKQWYGAEANGMPLAVKTTGKMGNKMTMAGDCMSSQTHMPMMQESLTSLKTTATFDRDLIQQMIRQNKMAVMTASMVLDNDRPELRTLAQATIKDQAAEITEFQSWYQAWFP